MGKRNKPASTASSESGVLILECLDKTDPGSEGWFLSHMFNVMEIPSQYVEIRTKEQFVAMMEANPFSFIHITMHGHVTEDEDEFRGFWTPKGTVKLADLSSQDLQGKTVVSTACLSGRATFAKAFMKSTRAKYYIAPEQGPKFHNSLYFAHWFYHNVFILKLSPREAIKKYRKGYKNPHDFTIYPKT